MTTRRNKSQSKFFTLYSNALRVALATDVIREKHRQPDVEHAHAASARQIHRRALWLFVCLALIVPLMMSLNFKAQTTASNSAGTYPATLNAALASATPIELGKISPCTPGTDVQFNNTNGLLLSTPLGSITAPVNQNFYKGKIDCNGAIQVTSGNLIFNDTTLPDTKVTGSLKVLKDVSGSLNPVTNAVNNKIVLQVNLSGSYDGVPIPKGCFLGPVTLNLSTATSGGIAYNANNGSYLLVDKSWTVNKLTDANGCKPLTGTFNSVLGLPWVAGQSTATFANAILPPVVPSKFAEVEDNSDKKKTNILPGIPNQVTGATNTTDYDYFQMSIPPGKSVTVEYTTKKITTEMADCNPDSTKEYPTGVSYTGPMLYLSGVTDYVMSSSEVNSGSCSANGLNGRVMTTTTETYKASKVYNNPMTTIYTQLILVYAINKEPGFPLSGKYTLTLTLK